MIILKYFYINFHLIKLLYCFRLYILNHILLKTNLIITTNKNNFYKFWKTIQFIVIQKTIFN